MHLLAFVLIVALIVLTPIFRIVLGWVFAVGGLLGLVVVFALLYIAMSRESVPTLPAPESAAAYRAAQRAVANATGKPCDYACKEAIADQARVKRSEADLPTSSL